MYVQKYEKMEGPMFCLALRTLLKSVDVSISVAIVADVEM